MSSRPSPFEGQPSHESPHVDILLDVEDLEEPLISGTAGQDDVAATTAAAAPSTSAPSPAPWPMMRRTSVSVRKVSPVAGFDPAEILSPSWAGGSGSAGGAPFFSFSATPPLGAGSVPPHDTFQRSVTPALDALRGLQPPESAAAVPPPPMPPPSPPPKRRSPAADAFTGLINAIIGMPVMLSFTAIIFRHRFFDPYLSPLVKLVFLSSAIHQAVFTAGSSMPFAVGQVQDVGLIFLSAMAYDVVEDCRDAGLGAADTLATALATLTAATAAVGLLIVATGALKLASAVQYCPLPVVGGYLAFVGFFMASSGAGLAAGVEISANPTTWPALLEPGPLLHLLPAVAMVVALSAVQRRARSPFALPMFLLAVPAAFYAVVLLGGWSLDEVRAAGWMASPAPEDSQWRFWKLYDLYKGGDISGGFPRSVMWSALPGQAGKLLGLYFVVAFGSSMDISAISADLPDMEAGIYNSELVTVGLSNLVTGAAGVGLTGSYIFSQTLFSLRMGVESRWMGAVVAVAEAAIFAAPVNTLAYLPSFFFGALVLWIGVDIAKDWLYIARKKVSPLEYAMLVGTFFAVAALGLEAGIALGVAAAALNFAVEYARVSVKAFSVVPSRSGAVRSFRQRMVLEAFDGRVAAVALSGMIFFGSATRMVDKVLEVAAVLLESQPRAEGGAEKQAPAAGAVEGGSSDEERPRRQGALSKKMNALRAVPSVRTLCNTYDGVAALAGGGASDLAPGTSAEFAGADVFLAAGEALQEAPLVLLLDLSRVHGIDATAARSFLALHSRLRRRGVRLALTGLRDDDAGRRMRQLLVGQGLILQRPTGPTDGGAAAVETDTACAWFPTMDEGLTWCEESFLHVAERHGLCEPSPQCVTLADVLRVNLEVPRAFLGSGQVDHATAGAALESFCVKETMVAGQVLFTRGDPSDSMYIVECGAVACDMDYSVSSVRGRAAAAVVPGELAVVRPSRVLVYGPGGIVGDLDFALQRQRSFVARCLRPGSVWRLTRREFERLAGEAPAVLVLLQTVVLRLNCLSASHALEALERSNF